jgi:MFS family permease
LSAVNLLNYVDRYVPAGALPLILVAFGASDAKGGLVMSMFMYAYALVSPLVGVVGDRAPRFLLAGIGVLVWSAATFASGLAPTFGVLLLARAVIGVGEASYAVVSPSLLADYFPAERRGRVLAFFYAAIPVGSAIGFAVGGAVSQHFGWRMAFYIAGAPGLALGLLLLLRRDPPRGAMDGSRGQAAPLAFADARRALLQRRSYLFNTASQTIYTFALGGLAGWMPTYFVRERHLDVAAAGTIFGALVCVSGLLGTLVGGSLGDKLAARRPQALFSLSGWALCASLPFTLLGVFAPQPWVFWPALGVTLFLLFLNTGPLNAAMTNVLPAALRARGFALYTLAIHALGDAPSPFLIGFASSKVGLTLPIALNGALLVVAGIVLLAGQKALAHDMAS